MRRPGTKFQLNSQLRFYRVEKTTELCSSSSVRAVAGLTITHHVDTAAKPESAWLESPEFATFFGRIDIATGI